MLCSVFCSGVSSIMFVTYTLAASFAESSSSLLYRIYNIALKCSCCCSSISHIQVFLFYSFLVICIYTYIRFIRLLRFASLWFCEWSFLDIACANANKDAFRPDRIIRKTWHPIAHATATICICMHDTVWMHTRSQTYESRTECKCVCKCLLIKKVYNSQNYCRFGGCFIFNKRRENSNFRMWSEQMKTTSNE